MIKKVSRAGVPFLPILVASPVTYPFRYNPLNLWIRWALDNGEPPNNTVLYPIKTYLSRFIYN